MLKWMILCFVLMTIARAMNFKAPSDEFIRNVKEGSQNSNALPMFIKFIQEFNRQYSNLEEFETRLKIFSVNLQISGGFYNNFSDLTEKEFADQYLTLKKIELDELKNNSLGELKVENAGELPKEFDWRDKGVVTKVKNQKQCGSCWAFSTTGNIESMFAIKYGNLKSFSEQQLVDCDTTSEGCGGGLPMDAFDYVKNAGGIQEEATYEYKGVKEACQADTNKFVAKVNGYNWISQDEEVIKSVLYNNGPLSVALNATMLQWYIKGVLDVGPPFTCDPKLLNHAVLIVGWSETKEGKKYWIVKNSWGVNWGEKGYFNIVYGKGECGINTQVTTSVIG